MKTPNPAHAKMGFAYYLFKKRRITIKHINKFSDSGLAAGATGMQRHVQKVH
jgi:hypothetical protein